MTDDTGGGPQSWRPSPPPGPLPPGPVPPPPPGPYGYAPHPAAAASGRPWAPKPGIIPLRPLGVGEILDGAFTALRWNPKPILIPAVILAVIEGVLTSVFTLLGVQTILSQARVAQQGPQQAAGTVGVLGITYGVLGIAAFLGTAVLTGLVTQVIGQAVLGRKETLGGAWRATRSRIGPVIAALLLAIVFIGLGLAAAIALCVGIGFGLAAVHVAPLGIVLGIVLGLAAVVFAVMVAIRWMFAIPVVVLEHAGPLKALGRSWRLVRGSWWRVFGISLLVSLIVSFVSAIIRTPFQVGDIFTTVGGPGGTGATGGVSTAGVILSAVGVIISTALTGPLQAGAQVVLYTDLRMRREGMDIALQSAVATGAQPLAGPPPGPSGPVPPDPSAPSPGSPEPGAW